MAGYVIERYYMDDDEVNFLYAAFDFIEEIENIMNQLGVNKIDVQHFPIYVCTAVSSNISGLRLVITIEDEIHYNAINLML